jgi:hypothetical protein
LVISQPHEEFSWATQGHRVDALKFPVGMLFRRHEHSIVMFSVHTTSYSAASEQLLSVTTQFAVPGGSSVLTDAHAVPSATSSAHPLRQAHAPTTEMMIIDLN